MSFIIEGGKWKITEDRREYNLGEDDRDRAPFRHIWELCPTSIPAEADQGIRADNPIKVADTNKAGGTAQPQSKRPWEL